MKHVMPCALAALCFSFAGNAVAGCYSPPLTKQEEQQVIDSASFIGSVQVLDVEAINTQPDNPVLKYTFQPVATYKGSDGGTFVVYRPLFMNLLSSTEDYQKGKTYDVVFFLEGEKFNTRGQSLSPETWARLKQSVTR